MTTRKARGENGIGRLNQSVGVTENLPFYFQSLPDRDPEPPIEAASPYLVQIPESGIPARAGDVPGVAVCEVVHAQPQTGDPKPVDVTQLAPKRLPVHNLTFSAINRSDGVNEILAIPSSYGFYYAAPFGGSAAARNIFIGDTSSTTTGDAGNSKSFSWGDPFGLTLGVDDWLQNTTIGVNTFLSGTAHDGTATADCWQIKQAGKLIVNCSFEFVGSLNYRDTSYTTAGHYRLFTPTFRCGLHNFGSAATIAIDPSTINEQFQLHDNFNYIPDSILLTTPGNSISGNNTFSGCFIFVADVAVDDKIVFGMGPGRRASSENVSITINHFSVELV